MTPFFLLFPAISRGSLGKFWEEIGGGSQTLGLHTSRTKHGSAKVAMLLDLIAWEKSIDKFHTLMYLSEIIFFLYVCIEYM
ncbi:hypothetical protein [Comamonas aquatica]|uniref:hypothetical protein n=1 Tax=Comamonas aquatica TaxID=225991 RepID=UPI001B397BED|nr:hypothetical protein [Comamonas aquatica]QTX19427.1 hypothetical protein KAQ61_10000 [Comamonas aquatica]